MKTVIFTILLTLGLGVYFLKAINDAKAGIDQFSCISYKLDANCLSSK